MERRQSPRARCQIGCDVALRHKTVEGLVRNVSDGGLAIEVRGVECVEGDSLAVTLKPRGHPPIEVVALAWNIRSLRRSGPAGALQLGLVLSEARDDYFHLVESLVARPSPARGTPALRPVLPRPPASAPAPAPEPPPLVHFAIRVAQTDSSRTRRILVRAPDAEAARERALEETGPGWSVVAISLARTT
jgi:hypothetical protein